MTTAIERRQRHQLATRAAETSAPLLATPLTRYAEYRAVTWERLADLFSMTTEQLDQIALCSPPRPGHWGEDVVEIATGFDIDHDRLHDLLWRALQTEGDAANG